MLPIMLGGRSSQGRAGRGLARLSMPLVGLLLGGAFAAAHAGSGTITGLCPDGSLFVVRQREAIPCSNAKLVEPSEVPPLRPELLPRPYTWEVYSQGADPNNPYNLIDAAREVRALRQCGAPAPSDGSALEGAPPVVQTSPPALGLAPASAASAPATLTLSDDEIRDLFLIVELSQGIAPAEFVKEGADGSEAMAVALAYSAAFEERLRGAHPQAASLDAGSVLLFSVVAQRAEPFHATLTFTQAHLAFSPDASNPVQLGLLQGRLGDLEAGEVVLGWIALPPAMNLRQPMGVYWNDRHAEVTFSP
jgi:hypothetical protein